MINLILLLAKYYICKLQETAFPSVQGFKYIVKQKCATENITEDQSVGKNTSLRPCKNIKNDKSEVDNDNCNSVLRFFFIYYVSISLLMKH